jgi:hypothetical protein
LDIAVADGDGFGGLGRRVLEGVGEGFFADVVLPFGGHFGDGGLLALPGDGDAVLDIETGVFAELLHVTDEVAGHAFADELRGEDGADGDLDTGVIGGHPFGGLLSGDEDIVGVEVDGLSVELDLDGCAASEGCEDSVSEFGEFGAEGIEEFAVAWTESFEVWFVGVGDEVIEVVLSEDGVDVEFFADDIGE